KAQAVGPSPRIQQSKNARPPEDLGIDHQSPGHLAVSSHRYAPARRHSQIRAFLSAPACRHANPVAWSVSAATPITVLKRNSSDCGPLEDSASLNLISNRTMLCRVLRGEGTHHASSRRGSGLSERADHRLVPKPC